MRALFPVILVLCAAFTATASAPDRSQRDREAREAFLGVNFFAEGRGMHMSPGLITHFNNVMGSLPAPEDHGSDMRTWFTHRWGLNHEGGKIVGLFDNEHEGLRIGSVGCVVCHSGRAAGQLVVGLGNKNIDVVQMAKDLTHLEGWWKNLVPSFTKSAAYVADEEDALAFASYLANEKIGNLSQGLVPVSFVAGWFYRVHGEPLPETMRRGQVKVPALWGYEEKRKVGLFSDGFGDAAEVGWGVLVELAAGQKPETVRSYYPKVQKAEEVLNHFLPPKYPFAVDERLAAQGRDVFENTCARCHGTYEADANGLPVYQAPRWIPLTVVKTDGDRAMSFNTDEFRAAVARSPLHDIVRANTREPGYFAPRLVGIWARFPYLHNGSVPSLAALLQKPSDRPTLFSLADAGERERFDETTVGLTLPPSRAMQRHLEWQAKAGKRDLYWTGREGHSNEGHDFHTDLESDDKKALLEYLKTL